ncbi:hypothetical protein SAMN05444481_12047 [Flavobacterium frigidimaris]|jgi:hypothetical protein|nr:hypothetical protein SAMN05444481_12047 [Flavobacterium frigidimaris]
MIDVYKLKILIVGLTTVLALTSFNKNDFRKGIVQSQNCNQIKD